MCLRQRAEVLDSWSLGVLEVIGSRRLRSVYVTDGFWRQVDRGLSFA